MAPEFKERRSPARLMMLIGIVLAVAAGGAAFVVMSQARQDAEDANVPLATVVVAARPIPARKVIDGADIAVHEIALDRVVGENVITDPTKVIGRVAAVPIFEGQPISGNLFASASGTGTIAVLGPDEVITANSPSWRAVALNVPPDRALGGLLEAGQTVDIFVTVPVSVNQLVADEGKYIAERSTKVAYQDVAIIAKSETFYVVRVTQKIAEEIAHLQASGTASFSFALRPDIDTRVTDTKDLGQTTNLIIQRYRIPVPESYPVEGDLIQNPPVGKPEPMPRVGEGTASKESPAP